MVVASIENNFIRIACIAAFILWLPADLACEWKTERGSEQLRIRSCGLSVSIVFYMCVTADN
jgi:hypothetical protein